MKAKISQMRRWAALIAHSSRVLSWTASHREKISSWTRFSKSLDLKSRTQRIPKLDESYYSDENSVDGVRCPGKDKLAPGFRAALQRRNRIKCNKSLSGLELSLVGRAEQVGKVCCDRRREFPDEPVQEMLYRSWVAYVDRVFCEVFSTLV